MADTFGGIEIPVPTTDDPVGDPALAKLGAFLQAALNDKIGAAWAALRPRPAGASFELPVRTVLVQDPVKRAFSDSTLPALFVYRTKGDFDRDGDGFDTDHASIRVIWIYPSDTLEKTKPRLPFGNAVAKVARWALERERHPDWVDAGDDDTKAPSYSADTDSILVAKATLLATHTYVAASLDGAIGDDTMAPRREVTITTSVAAGAYNTGSAITITGVDAFGRTRTWTVTLTDADGGETIGIGEDIRSVTQVALPAMLDTDGTISIGTSSVRGRGSNYRERCGFRRCHLRSWQPVPIAIDILDAHDKRKDTATYDAIELQIDVLEFFSYDPDADADVGVDGADLTVLQGDPFDDDSFIVERTLD
jgi:hypothetical protein